MSGRHRCADARICPQHATPRATSRRRRAAGGVHAAGTGKARTARLLSTRKRRRARCKAGARRQRTVEHVFAGLGFSLLCSAEARSTPCVHSPAGAHDASPAFAGRSIVLPLRNRGTCSHSLHDPPQDSSLVSCVLDAWEYFRRGTFAPGVSCSTVHRSGISREVFRARQRPQVFGLCSRRHVGSLGKLLSATCKQDVVRTWSKQVMFPATHTPR